MDGNNPCLGVTGVLFLLFALPIFWNAVKDWWAYRASENWLPVNGQVTATEVAVNSGDENTTDTYTPVVIYVYQFMGQKYEGRLISFGSKGVTYGSRKKAEKIIARYPVGSQPTVYYDPNDPSQAVLERKFMAYNVIFGLGVGLCGLGMIYLGFIQ